MPALSDYTAGTITLTNNSTAFTGSGTGWQAADFREGDVIFQVAGQTQWTAVVQSITSNTAGTLVRPWGGATGTYQYRMRYMADGARVTAQARNLIELLGNGNLQAEASLTGAADSLSYYTGPATKALTPLTAFARTLLDDANAAAARGTLDVAQKQTAPNDATAGRGMVVGAFGLGGTSWILSSGSLSDPLLPNGLYYASTGVTDKPVGAGAGWVLTQRVDIGNAKQEFTELASKRTWTRVITSGVPNPPWILQGTEVGNTAGGWYVRFGDGTQICWNPNVGETTAQNALEGDIYYGSVLWTFPASFTGTPFVTSLARNAARWGGSASPISGGTSANLFHYQAVTSPSTVLTAIGGLAVGRWF